LLEKSNSLRGSIVAYVILSHNPNHADALAALRRNKSSGNLNDRIIAGRLLFESLGETNDLCLLIEEGFKSPQSHIGQSAAHLADLMGRAALPTVPALKQALWHKDKFVRERAGQLLRKLAPEALPIQERKGGSWKMGDGRWEMEGPKASSLSTEVLSLRSL